MSGTDEFGNPVGDSDYIEHSHEIESPISEEYARDRLASLSINQLNEIARADGLAVVGGRGTQIKVILSSWFHSVTGIAGRVISFQDQLDRAENLPQNEKRVWRKKTFGKEMGIKAKKIIPTK